jgi:curli production assembly/transport component CsgG
VARLASPSDLLIEMAMLFANPFLRRAPVALASTLVLALAGCGVAPLRAPTHNEPMNVNADAVLTPTTRITRELVRLPAPKFKVPVAVYAFRDQTGQFKSQPDSNLSNAVTQGAASILVKALLDSGWYLPIEREGFQNLLTERRVAKALESPTDKGKPGSSYPSLLAANFLIEGGVIGYESNVRTGGTGASLLGIGAETKYRVDQVTVNLRSVDVRSGQVVNSVSVTKTIFSHEISANVYRFVSYKTLLQAEGGYSTNEPTQLAVKEAIESAVIHLTVQGMRDGAWALKDEKDWNSALVQNYLREAGINMAEDPAQTRVDAEPVQVSMREPTMVLPPSPPLPISPVRAMANNVARPPVVSQRPTEVDANAAAATEGRMRQSAPLQANDAAPVPSNDVRAMTAPRAPLLNVEPEPDTTNKPVPAQQASGQPVRDEPVKRPAEPQKVQPFVAPIASTVPELADDEGEVLLVQAAR